MRKSRGRIATRFVAIAFAAALLACLVYRPDRALRTATGTAAHDLCSESFVSQLDPKQNFAESLAPRPRFRWLAWAVNHEVDTTRREARASLLGVLPSRAVFRDGVGCVLVHGNERIATAKLGGAVRVAPLLPAIAGSVAVEAADPGLKAAVDAAFLEAQQPPYAHIKAIVMYMFTGCVRALRLRSNTHRAVREVALVSC